MARFKSGSLHSGPLGSHDSPVHKPLTVDKGWFRSTVPQILQDKHSFPQIADEELKGQSG